MSGAVAAVSVVIPHYGDPRPALALVDQLRAQSTPPAQIVVVDDCSPEPFPETDGVDLVRRPVNGGFGAAVNTAVEAVTGSHLLILNSDLSIGDAFVADLVAAATPWQPAVCGPMLVSPDGENQWSGRHFPRTRHYVVEWLTPLARFRGRLQEAVGHDTMCVPGATVPVDWLVGAVLLVPTVLFRRAGGFDEGFHMNCEEVDLQRRLRDAGIPSVFCGGVSATHVGGGSSGGEIRRRWVTQARLRYARKWREHPVVLRTSLQAASAVNLVANTLRRLARRDVAPWRTFRTELGYLRGGAGR